MVTLRSAKSKGSQFEMDVEYSLKKVFSNIRRLGGEGQYREIDLIDDVSKISVECKKHKSFSWNELVGYLKKLTERSGYPINYLVFQENYKPVFIMRNVFGIPSISLFEDLIGIKFEKHKTIKRKKEFNGVGGKK